MTIENTAATVGEWEAAHRPIVVAVDGSERNRSAVTWAAHEAATLGCDVDLVTALHDHHVRPPLGRPDPPGSLAILERARAEVEQVHPGHAVRTHAVPGAPLEVLLERAPGARLVVVGKRGLGGFARLLVGSTSVALAGRCPVPVAVIPDSGERTVHDVAPVVLGVDPFQPDHHPIHLAFRRARRLGVPLVAVHGWEAPTVFSWDAGVVTGAVTEHERDGEIRFDALLADWRQHYPEVVVRPMRVHKHPAAALLDAAEDAQLVVLGRHRHGLLGGFTLGSVARAVLHYAECPVIVVPADDAGHVPGPDPAP